MFSLTSSEDRALHAYLCVIVAATHDMVFHERAGKILARLRFHRGLHTGEAQQKYAVRQPFIFCLFVNQDTTHASPD